MSLRDRSVKKQKVKEVDSQKDTEIVANSNKKRDYGEKIDFVYAQMSQGDAFIEVMTDGFNLKDENKGIGASKVHFNFAKLNKNQKQEVFVSHFLDVSNFMALRWLFLSGKIFELENEKREEAKKKKSKFIDSVYSEYKAPDSSSSKNFSITPGMKSGNWMVNISYTHEGRTERVGVPMKTERLVAMLELIYLAYQKHLKN